MRAWYADKANECRAYGVRPTLRGLVYIPCSQLEQYPDGSLQLVSSSFQPWHLARLYDTPASGAPGTLARTFLLRLLANHYDSDSEASRMQEGGGQ